MRSENLRGAVGWKAWSVHFVVRSVSIPRGEMFGLARGVRSMRFDILCRVRGHIEVLHAARSIDAAALLLSIDWSTAQNIMKRAVERGLKRRSLDEVKHVGIDEKSFRKGQVLSLLKNAVTFCLAVSGNATSRNFIAGMKTSL